MRFIAYVQQNSKEKSDRWLWFGCRVVVVQYGYTTVKKGAAPHAVVRERKHTTYYDYSPITPPPRTRRRGKRTSPQPHNTSATYATHNESS